MNVYFCNFVEGKLKKTFDKNELKINWNDLEYLVHCETEKCYRDKCKPFYSDDEASDGDYFIPNAIVRLEVGGRNFEILSNTLVVSPFFNEMLRNNENVYKKIKRKNKISIQRHGRLFEYIFQYLITEKTDYLPTRIETLLRLRNEADFYKLHVLQKAIDTRIRALDTINNEKQQRTFRVLSMNEFEGLVYNKSYATGKRSTLLDEYEVITTVDTQDRYWLCSRNVRIHKDPEMCSKACKRAFDPDQHGWQFIDATKVVIATRIE